MILQKKIPVLLILIPLFMGLVSEEENQASTQELLGKTINFIVLFGGLIFILYKPFRRFLDKRAQEIENDLDEGQKSREEAQKKLDKAKSRLEKLNQEVQKMEKKAEKEGQIEKEQILQAAQEEVGAIKKETKQEIDSLTSAGIQELKEYSAELAVKLAEQRIRKKISLQDQRRLIDKSIHRIGEMDGE